MTVLPRKRRGVELVLIVFALAITLGGYAIVDFNVTGGFSPVFGTLAGVCVGLAILAHLAVRWRLPYADPVILPCVILLNGLGLIMIHRIDPDQLTPDDRCPPAADLDGIGSGRVHSGGSRAARSPAAAAVHLHSRSDRRRVAPAPLVPGTGEVRRADLDPGRNRTASSRPRQPRSCCRSRSPPTWWRSGTSWRSPGTASSASTFRAQ